MIIFEIIGIATVISWVLMLAWALIQTFIHNNREIDDACKKIADVIEFKSKQDRQGGNTDVPRDK